jgi:nucleotide-binding universal stress UspA family protein
MRIVAGIGESDQWREARRVAATLTRKSDGHLVLIHAGERTRRGVDIARQTCDDSTNEVRRAVIRRVPDVAARCYAGLSAREGISQGVAEHDADLVVLGSASMVSGLLAYSPAVALAQSLTVPVLTILDSDPICSATDGRPLRVLLASDAMPASMPGILWTIELARLIPCVITVACSVCPPVAHARFRIPPPTPLRTVDPRLRTRLIETFDVILEPLRRHAEVDVLIEATFTNTARHLEAMARNSRAGLIVASSSQRDFIQRLVRPATTRALLKRGNFNICSVPLRWNAPLRDQLPSAGFRPAMSDDSGQKQDVCDAGAGASRESA